MQPTEQQAHRNDALLGMRWSQRFVAIEQGISVSHLPLLAPIVPEIFVPEIFVQRDLRSGKRENAGCLPGRQIGDRADQRLGFHGFGEMHLEAGSQCVGPILKSGEGGQGHGRQPLGVETRGAQIA